MEERLVIIAFAAKLHEIVAVLRCFVIKAHTDVAFCCSEGYGVHVVYGNGSAVDGEAVYGG